MKNVKRLLGLFLVACLMVSLMPATFAANEIAINVDGTVISSDTAPVLESGTTLVPVAIIAQYLGADVSWNNTTRQATIKTAGYTVVFTIDSKTYTVNGASKTLDVAAKIINRRTMIPIRAMTEAIGAQVSYDSASRTVSVKYFSNMTGSIKVSGSTTVQPIAQAVAIKLLSMNAGLTISVAAGGSGAGIKEAISGANNVGMSSRVLTADELKQVDPIAFANDGIAIITHPSNPVSNITKEQAEKIFLGEIVNWKDVGGNDAPILVQTRETGSGTLGTLMELLLENKPLVATATPHTSSALIKQAVAANVNAVGFDSIGFVDSTVKVVSLNNVKPSKETVKGGTYLLGRSLFLLTKGTPASINAKFIDFFKSEYAQKQIVEKEGYISIR